jgi:hypothetical protein
MQNNISIKNIFYIVLLIIFVNCIDAQESIQVSNNEIRFIGGKILKLEKDDFYHIYLNKKRVVVIMQKKYNQGEYSEYTIHFFNFPGEEISHTDKFRGEFVFKYFDETGRVLVWRRDRYYTGYLYDLDGVLIKEIVTTDQENKEIGVADNENYFWFIANKLRPIKEGEKPLHPFPPYTRIMPYNHVKIFNSLTGEIEREYDVNGIILNFKLNNKKYTIRMSQADFPG